ncbi:MAG: 1-aminocyclopropane-carboxylate deaminase [Pseudomonadota bacterium]
MRAYKDSPVQEIRVFNKAFWLKRDDLLDTHFSGNKARKFYSLLNADLSNFKTILSIGGVQSNAMYSLSVLAKLKNLQFRYYTKKIPTYLKQNPSGNYLAAIKNGMNIIELDDCDYKTMLCAKSSQDELFIAQGGADELANDGLKLLAQELNEFCKDMKNPKAIISCGTGTSALYLNRYFYGKVYAVPCVGDGAYLLLQFNRLSLDEHRPTILATAAKYSFGKPHMDIYNIYKELLNAGVEFDLLYDAIAWIAVKENIELFDSETVFIHSGGLLGNETMLERYIYKFKQCN